MVKSSEPVCVALAMNRIELQLQLFESGFKVGWVVLALMC